VEAELVCIDIPKTFLKRVTMAVSRSMEAFDGVEDSIALINGVND
jgi:hypothetical protein